MPHPVLISAAYLEELAALMRREGMDVDIVIEGNIDEWLKLFKFKMNGRLSLALIGEELRMAKSYANRIRSLRKPYTCLCGSGSPHGAEECRE